MKTIEQMRPDELYQKILKQRKFDGKLFYKKYYNQFIEVGCPACGQQGQLCFSKYGFEHRTCNNCGTLFCSPRPSESLLTEYYTYWKSPKLWTSLLIKTDINRKKLQYLPRVKKIISVMKEDNKKCGGVAVDVGAGSGAFAFCLKQSSFFSDIITVDLSEECISACKRLGFNAKQNLKDIPDNFAHLLTLNDIVEHLFNPYQFLVECYKKLKKNGYIAIATPNGEGFDFKIMKEKTVNITPPEHLNYFNTYSIRFLLEKVGFKVIDLSTPGKLDVQIVLKSLKSDNRILRGNEYIKFLLSQNEEVLENFQYFLSSNKLSSHMLCIAKKIRREL